LIHRFRRIADLSINGPANRAASAIDRRAELDGDLAARHETIDPEPGILTESSLLDASPTRYSARREEILAAAAEVLNNQGSRGFTVALVAQRLGLHPVSLTYYFKRRRDLLSACLLSTIDRFEALVADAEAAGWAKRRPWPTSPKSAWSHSRMSPICGAPIAGCSIGWPPCSCPPACRG
jgi:hypothetical protein